MEQPKAGHYTTSSCSWIGQGCNWGRGLGVEGGKGKDKLKARDIIKESHCQLIKLSQVTLWGLLGANIRHC